MAENVIIHWNIDPVFLQIGPFSSRWYGIFFAAAFVAGFGIMRWIYEKEDRNIGSLESLGTHMFLGTIAGARLGHCLFYDPAWYFSHPLEILKIWEGGLASHGAAIGILLALFLYTLKNRDISYIQLIDRIVIPAALGGAFIRTGNFFNSEILGIPSSAWFSVVFERVDSIPRHPVQLYESCAYFLTFMILIDVYRKNYLNLKTGMLTGLFLVSVFSARFVLEFFKMNQAAYESGFIISVGQWLSLPFIVAGVVLLCRKN